LADFKGRLHFFYIERRLQEGTPFYPGHEIFFGHASTADFVNWEVHDPVMLIRPDTWEEAHVWAPCVIRRGDEFIMAYTGLNRHISQNIGLASSKDLFEWRRWDSNPISPCKGKDWAFWREDMISSCRDPSICEHDGRYWMIFTANTREGASCIAMTSTKDFKRWEDHGPICIGPAAGYEPRLEGGHPQGSLESSNLFFRKGKWFLTVKAKVRDEKTVNWIIESDSNLKFDFAKRRVFWPGAMGIEIARQKGDRNLLATFGGGHIKFGLTDWSQDTPTGRFIESEDELAEWKVG
jgi:sucrose-6-phosphate hydrolase SacC (GH32 family)